jgi:hypothetical protein
VIDTGLTFVSAPSTKGKMQSIIALKHRWNNPLNGMKSSAVGLYPLPVELWEKIFAFATDADEYWAETQGDWCTILNPFFSSKEEDLLRDPTAWNGQSLLHTRHSIPLVCKSWYFMGIPVLWSHLQLDEKDTRSVATTIYCALKRNPVLACHVIRLTVRPVDACPGETRIKGTQSINKILPLLYNLKALSCSMHVAAKLPSSLRPQIAVIHAQEHKEVFSHHGFYIHQIIRPNYFWYNCRVLSFTFTRQVWYSIDQKAQIVFKNLTDLRVQIEHTGILRWIINTWNLPRLKNLSLIVAEEPLWIWFLKKVRLTIERLQIPRSTQFLGPSERIFMPKLQELYLIGAEDPSWNGMADWHRWLTCPKLHRCVLLVDSMSTVGDFQRPSVVTHLDDVQRLQKSIKELGIIIPFGKWMYPYERGYNCMLFMSDIRKWCDEGLKVNITMGRDGQKERYTNDLPLQISEFYRVTVASIGLQNTSRGVGAASVPPSIYRFQ